MLHTIPITSVDLTGENEFVVSVVALTDPATHVAGTDGISQVMVRMRWDRTGVELISHALEKADWRLKASVGGDGMRRDRDRVEGAPRTFLVHPAIMARLPERHRLLSQDPAVLRSSAVLGAVRLAHQAAV